MFRAATADIDTTPYVQQILGMAENEGAADGAEDEDGADEEAKQQ
jgi:hypothetical protein